MNFLRRYSTVNNSNNVLQDKFKKAMSRVSSQAMILTAGFKDIKNVNLLKTMHGMTLSSVCSLSVYPKPLLQFNLQLPSSTSRALHKNDGVVAIHLLAANSKSSELGRIFASGIKRPNTAEFKTVGEEKDGEFFHEMATPFRKIEENAWRLETYKNYKIPILNHSEVVFICSKRMVIEVDGHEIWVVNVLDTLESLENKTGGLIYFNRAFHKVGDMLED